MSTGRTLVPVGGEAAATLAADRNPALVYVARLAPGSRRVQLGALRTIAELLERGSDLRTLHWAALRYQHTQAVRARLAELYAPATANRLLAALRGTLKEAWRLGLVDREAYERAADLEPVRGSRLAAGRHLSDRELEALFAAASIRDAALLALLYGAGLRRSEAAALELADVGGYVRVRRGKGNKELQVPLPDDASAWVAAWISARGQTAGALLCRLQEDGTPRSPIVGLTGQGIRSALIRLAAAAGVAAFTPHDMRRTFISNLLDSGIDIATVQKLAGHSKVDTTARYDRRGEETRRRAVSHLRMPKR